MGIGRGKHRHSAAPSELAGRRGVDMRRIGRGVGLRLLAISGVIAFLLQPSAYAAGRVASTSQPSTAATTPSGRKPPGSPTQRRSVPAVVLSGPTTQLGAHADQQRLLASGSTTT